MISPDGKIPDVDEASIQVAGVPRENPIGLLRLFLAMLPPLVAFILQSIFWPAIRPYVWVLFYPAVFFSSWIGGLPSGLMATVISTALVWWAFIPPEYSFMMKNPQSFLSAAVFMGMGVLFSFFHGRLRKANKETAEAFTAVSSAKDQLETRVHERTADLARSNESLWTEVAPRKRAEEKMRLQSAALESAANAFVITDRDGIITWVNPAFTKLTGYSPEEAIGQNLRLLTSGTQDRSSYENLWNTILSGQVWSGEIVNRRKDGALYTEEQTITPVRNDQGEVTHFIAIKQDITERKRAEKERSRLISIIEATTDFVGIADPQARAVYLNKNGRKMVGIGEDEDISDFQVAESHPEPARKFVLEEAIPTAIREGVWQGENILLTRDGRDIPVSQVILAHRAPDGSVEFLSTIMRDVTERKRAEKEIQRNLERIRAVHEIDKAITSTLDLRAVLDVLVEKTVQLLPYSASLVWLRNPQTGSLERAACWNLDEKEWKESKFLGTPLLVKTAIDTQAPIAIRNIQTDPRTMDSDFYRKEGLVSYLGIPLIAKDKVVGVLVFLTKEEHEFTRDEMEFLVTLADQAAIAIHNSQLYEEMRNMAGSLAKSNRVKDEFLSVMSHELRTPLTAVVGYTGLLQDGTLQGIGQEKALNKIMKHSQELLSMIDSILQASTLEANEVTARMNEIHLSRILDDIRSGYDFPLEKELTLHWEYAPDLPVIRTDGGKLKQILQNLINNAIKFTEKGSVTVSARITFAPLLPCSSAPLLPCSPAEELGGRGAGGSFVEFKVADTGVGIHKESFPIIFEMFRQIDSSETRLYGGVGLGLFIAKKFTELLGGTVAVESEPGAGSAFTVTLPLSAVPDHSQADQVHRLHARKKGEGL